MCACHITTEASSTLGCFIKDNTDEQMMLLDFEGSMISCSRYVCVLMKHMHSGLYEVP